MVFLYRPDSIDNSMGLSFYSSYLCAQEEMDKDLAICFYVFFVFLAAIP
jgi:hypothetical protein